MSKIQTTTHMTRRALLGGALATAAVAVAGPVLAQRMQTHMPPGVAPKPKGPLVFLDYDKDEIDAAYDQGPWAPNQAEVGKRNAQKRAAALTRLGPPRRLAYGSTEIEKLDLYSTKQPNAPMNVVIHGGAWHGGGAASAAYMSEMFVDSGAHFIALDFNNVIETNGNLMTMAQQVRRGVSNETLQPPIGAHRLSSAKNDPRAASAERHNRQAALDYVRLPTLSTCDL